MDDYDVVIIGAGAMGSATAYYLAKAGKKVLLAEQFEFLHKKGSSHGDSRIIRKTYVSKHFSNMMDQAYLLWEEVQKEAGKSVIRKTGGLDFGPEDNEYLRDTLDICQKQGFNYEKLDTHELRVRYPMLQIPDGYIGIYQPDAGIIHAKNAVAMFQELATNHGAILQDHAKVISIDNSKNKILLDLKGEQIRTDKLIITAGGWLKYILKKININLDITVWKLSYGYYQVKDISTYENFPIFICMENKIFYGFPINERSNSMKIGPHYTIETFEDADQRDFNPNPKLINQVNQFVKNRFLGIDDTPIETDTCLYTMTETEDFILDTLPSDKRIIIAGGFSGHGFKFTPLIGKIVSQLALEDEVEIDLRPFKISKFLK